jgi:purine-binding chemotaxis protein CheW
MTNLPASDRTENFILFDLANATYAVSSQVVKQMEMVETITPVPNTASFVDGVVFSRGQVIPAINLRVRFGFEKIAYDMRNRLIVIQSDDRIIGLIVDTAREFVTIPENAIQSLPESMSEQVEKYLSGIAKLGDRLVLILDAQQLLDPKEIAVPALIKGLTQEKTNGAFYPERLQKSESEQSAADRRSVQSGDAIRR